MQRTKFEEDGGRRRWLQRLFAPSAAKTLSKRICARPMRFPLGLARSPWRRNWHEERHGLFQPFSLSDLFLFSLSLASFSSHSFSLPSPLPFVYSHFFSFSTSAFVFSSLSSVILLCVSTLLCPPVFLSFPLSPCHLLDRSKSAWRARRSVSFPSRAHSRRGGLDP